MSIKKRVERLEIESGDTTDLPVIERIVVNSSEQVNHPERFIKVLDEEKETESGAVVRICHYERKKEV